MIKPKILKLEIILDDPHGLDLTTRVLVKDRGRQEKSQRRHDHRSGGEKERFEKAALLGSNMKGS